MKPAKIAIAILAVLFLAIVILAARYGFFKSVHIKIEPNGGQTLVYENQAGSYDQTPATIEKIKRRLEADHIAVKATFGIFYDDPRHTEKEKLRAEAGCIIEKPADEAAQVRLAQNYRVKTLPEARYLMTSYPLDGQLSILFGMMKAYPAINDYLKANNIPQGPIIEIYDPAGKRILYLKEFKQD